MEKSQESAAESEPQRHGSFRFIEQRSVVQLKLLQRVSEISVFRSVRRIKAAVHHGLDFLVAGQRLRAGSGSVRHRIAHTGISHILDTCRKISYHSCGELVAWNETSRAEISHLHNFRGESGSHHPHSSAFLHTAVHNTAEHDHAFVGIIDRIEDKGLERSLRISLGRRDLLYDLLKDFFHILSCLGRDLRRVLCFQSDHILDLVDHTLGIRTGKIDLIDHRQDVQIMIQRKINIGKGLGLDPLSGVHHKDRAVTGRKASGYFIIKIHMSRGIYQVKNIFFSVFCLIYDTDRLGFDRNASLPLQIHIVQHLRLHLPLREQSCLLYDTVGQSGLAMVYMCNNTEITNLVLVCHFAVFLLFVFHVYFIAFVFHYITPEIHKSRCL